MRKLLLLRPEPGLSQSAKLARKLGLEPILAPLFRIEAVEWSVPDPGEFEALLITSANAVVHAGPPLSTLSHLPVHAVGAATAAAAREAGLTVASIGETGVGPLLAALPEAQRLLHLAGEDRHAPATHHRIRSTIVYRAAAIAGPALPPLAGLVIAVHSPRAGARLADLAKHRDRCAIAAISTAAAAACGSGWQEVGIAERPADDCLLALASRLCHTFDPA